jgi:hypothetical protein
MYPHAQHPREPSSASLGDRAPRAHATRSLHRPPTPPQRLRPSSRDQLRTQEELRREQERRALAAQRKCVSLDKPRFARISNAGTRRSNRKPARGQCPPRARAPDRGCGAYADQPLAQDTRAKPPVQRLLGLFRRTRSARVAATRPPRAAPPCARKCVSTSARPDFWNGTHGGVAGLYPQTGGGWSGPPADLHRIPTSSSSLSYESSLDAPYAGDRVGRTRTHSYMPTSVPEKESQPRRLLSFGGRRHPRTNCSRRFIDNSYCPPPANDASSSVTEDV